MATAEEECRNGAGAPLKKAQERKAEVTVEEKEVVLRRMRKEETEVGPKTVTGRQGVK